MYLYPDTVLLMSKRDRAATHEVCLEIHAGAHKGHHGPFSSSDECVVEIQEHDKVVANDNCYIGGLENVDIS